MYTFDAVWTLIQALSRLAAHEVLPSIINRSNCFKKSLQNHDCYYRYLKETRFAGVSGQVQFSKNQSNDRVNGIYYALYTIQRSRSIASMVDLSLKYARLMVWSEPTRAWLNDSSNMIWLNQTDQKTSNDYPKLKGEHLLANDLPLSSSPPL